MDHAPPTRVEKLAIGFNGLIPSIATAIVVLITVVCVWALYKRSKLGRTRRKVNYQRVVVSDAPLQPDKINALVTGGSGMLGKEIIRCLIEDGGYNVHSLDLFIPEEKQRHNKVCSYIQADITNFSDLVTATKGMDVVFHTAAILPTVMGAKNSDFYDVIFGGTSNVVKACRECKVKRLIYTSTADVVISKGKVGVANTDEDHPLPEHPLNAYVGAKGMAETAVLAANRKHELLTCALRPGGILELVIYPKLRHLIHVGDKERILPLVACDDLAKAHVYLDSILIAKNNIAAGRAFNLCWNIPESELDEAISSERDDERKSIGLPMIVFTLLTYFNVAVHWIFGVPPVNALMTMMALDIMKLKYHSYLCTRAQQELGLRLTPWKDTVKKLIGCNKETN